MLLAALNQLYMIKLQKMRSTRVQNSPRGTNGFRTPLAFVDSSAVAFKGDPPVAMKPNASRDRYHEYLPFFLKTI